MAERLDGKQVANQRLEQLKSEISTLSVPPKLVVVLVGEDPASQTYVKNKAKKCAQLGLVGETQFLNESTTQEELIGLIESLNDDKSVHGILVQLPLPKHIDKTKVMESISPFKDVDGFHAINQGLLYQGNTRFAPCTPAGVIEMLKHYEIPIEGKNAVVIGRSEIVGKPMALLLLSENATVTICHSRTQNLIAHTKNADILVAAAGIPKFVTDEHVKPGAVVVDVGIHRVDGKLCGDVEFSKVEPVASYLSPVPGGVGPLTIAMLMVNVVKAAKLAQSN